MAIVKCANAHYYDNEKYKECPHCARLAEQGASSGMSSAVYEDRQVENYAAEYVRQNTGLGNKARDRQEANVRGQERGAKEPSEGVHVEKCTAGWLVCVSGAEYGRDFPLYAGFNRIGRDSSNDIVLTDLQISRDEHFSLVYEERKNVFYLYPKAGNLIYLGEEPVDIAKEIKSGEVITAGETKLEFIAFCIGEKRWAKR